MEVFDILPSSYTVTGRATIKLKVVTEKVTRKHPDVVGYICYTRDFVERMAKRIQDEEQKGNVVAFIQVALWDTSGEYGYTGSIDASQVGGRYDVPLKPAERTTQSDWY